MASNLLIEEQPNNISFLGFQLKFFQALIFGLFMLDDGQASWPVVRSEEGIFRFIFFLGLVDIQMQVFETSDDLLNNCKKGDGGHFWVDLHKLLHRDWNPWVQFGSLVE